mgnify:CR=1
MYHGGGGFIHSEVYNMPIWLRRFHISRINEHVTKQNEEMEKSQGKSQMGDNNSLKGPNVSPSSNYNIPSF